VTTPSRCDSQARAGDAHSAVAATDPVVAEVEVPASALVMCSWCKRVEVDGWCEVGEAVARRAELLEVPAPPIAHGICPDCHRALLASVK
jgi:hypothetical protein